MEESNGTVKNGKQKKKKYTREELTEMLWKMKEELGRPPSRKDLPDGMFQYFRNEFGKWCYALQETGVRPCSEKVLEKRRKRKEKLRQQHKRMSYRRSVAGRREAAEREKRERQENNSGAGFTGGEERKAEGTKEAPED